MSRGGFITDTIPGYNKNPDDFERVVDFMSSYCQALDGDILNICAWFNKKTGFTYFGGQWAYDVPPKMFGSGKNPPSEEKVWEWARKHSYICKKMDAIARREKKWKERMDGHEEYFRKNGVNFVYLVIEVAGGIKEIKQPCGKRGILEMLREVTYNILNTPKYKNGVIKKLTIKNKSYDYTNKWWAGENRDFNY